MHRFWQRHHASNRPAAIWLLLASWLAFWPAAEARQAAARERMPMPRPVAAAVARGCCQARPAPQASRQPSVDDDSAQRGCCSRPSGSPARGPSCPEGGASRCAQCFGYGALLMFAHAQPVPDPERPMLGAIRHGDLAACSRDLRPPVPPPRTTGQPLFV